MKTKKIPVLVMATIMLLSVASVTGAGPWFSDDFGDGIIHAEYWQHGGDGIFESGGVLSLDRNCPEDYIQSTYTYSGNFVVEIDIRLNYIHWNDMFHGVTITDDLDHFGFYGVSLVLCL